MQVNEDSNTQTNCDSIRIVLADDHTIVRHGIKQVLESTGDYEIVGEAETADEAIAKVASESPEILLLDLGLPGKSGLEVLFELKETKVETRVVVLTMHENEIMAKQAISAGARAYLLKDCPPAELLEAIKKVHAGECVVPEKYKESVEEKKSGKSGSAKEGDPLGKLSKREREVFFMLADGKPNRVIAKELFISPRTVETHRARVIKKLGFDSTADLIRYAIKHKLVEVN